MRTYSLKTVNQDAITHCIIIIMKTKETQFTYGWSLVSRKLVTCSLSIKADYFRRTGGEYLYFYNIPFN